MLFIPHSQGIGVRLLAFLLIVLVAGCTRDESTSPPAALSREAIAETSAPSVQEKPAAATAPSSNELHAVSAMMASKYFEANEVRALRVFGDSRLVLVGRVDRIRAGADGPDVYLAGEDDDVVCEFAPQVAAEVERLTKGSTAAISGIPYRATFGLGLRNCRVVPEGAASAPGGFREFREFEVSYLKNRLAELEPLRAAAARLSEIDGTNQNISRQKQIEADLAAYLKLLAEAERDMKAADPREDRG